MPREYDKLVRDGIPSIVRDDGEEPVVRTVDGAEYVEYLERKLLEEAEECVEEPSTEELADVLEVLHALCDARGTSMAAVERTREAKRAEKGGFERGIVLERVR